MTRFFSNTAQRRPRRPATRRRPARRGVAILIVLALIAITLALSYAMMRTQSTSVLMQANLSRLGDARQAAVAGATVALRKMHQSDWPGVGTTLTGQLSRHQSYEVTYEAGDPSLAPGDPEYAESAYRVTLTSTGYAKDPSNPAVQVTHRVRLVVRLVPRNTPAEPTDWSTFQQYTVYQGNQQDFQVELPSRITGPVRVQGRLKIADKAPNRGAVAKTVLFVVAKPGNLTVQDKVKQALMQSWGYTVTPIAANDSQAHFDAAVAGSDVAYISEEIFSGDLGTKLRNAPIGVVSEEPALADEFGLASGYAKTYETTLNVVNNTQCVTAPFPLGPLAIFSSLQEATTLSGTLAPGLLVLGRWGTVKSLAVVEAGGLLFDGGAAAGRRVQLPWGGNAFNFGSLNGDGKMLMKHALWWADGDDPREQYLEDLERMRLAGLDDDRPLDGPVHVEYAGSEDGLCRLAMLGVGASDTAPTPFAADWIKPTALSTYQIYPGGPIYTIPTISGILENTTLAPDQTTNPLGIRYRAGNLEIRDNVTVRGSLFCTGDITVKGTNVRVEPVDLPPKYGSGGVIRLPVATCKSFFIARTSGGSLTGLVAAFDRFVIKRGPETEAFSITGRIVVSNVFKIKERDEWVAEDWNGQLQSFQAQLPTVPYFPVWMGTQGRSPTPLLTIGPDSGETAYHWPNWGQPIFLPGPGDAGLMWDLIEWTDAP